MDTLLLRAALKRGLIVATANWPVVLIDFAVDSFRKLALTIPVIGGALMVGTLVGTDLTALLAQGVMATADVVLGSLATSPAALSAFLAALTLVAVGGEVLTFVVKAGTLTVLVEADRRAGEVHRAPIGVDSLTRARAFTLDHVLEGARHFGRRMAGLALVLGGSYSLLALIYVLLVSYGVAYGGGAAWLPAWSLFVLLSTSAGIVVVGAVNLGCDLLRVVMVTSDCSLGVAVTRVRRFVVEDARQVIGIFSVIGAVEILATAVSLLAAAGLTPVAYLPIVSLIIVPIQLAVWLLRGLVFEWLALSSVSAYQTQYRRFAQARWASPQDPSAPAADGTP
jgi:hypothetical protein